jgi:hypothetical protein
MSVIEQHATDVAGHLKPQAPPTRRPGNWDTKPPVSENHVSRDSTPGLETKQ